MNIARIVANKKVKGKVNLNLYQVHFPEFDNVDFAFVIRETRSRKNEQIPSKKLLFIVQFFSK